MKTFFVSNRKLLTVCLVLSLMVSAMSVVGFASDPPSVQNVITTSFGGIVEDLIATLLALLPVFLPLFGLSVAVVYSIRWFKKLLGS
jgi:hypothetical protein